MTRKLLVPLLLALSISTITEAQVFIGGGFGGGGFYRPRPHREMQDWGDFKPSWNISVGYGFPNLDRYLMDEFYGYYSGSKSQMGPINATVDYQFNPRMSIGVMVNYGQVSRNYYSGYSGNQAFTGTLNNASILLNLTQYMRTGSPNVMPYLRTAIGVNTGTVQYQGTNAPSSDDNPTLAYQISIGSKFFVSQNTGFFIEAGYGKYILSGGLTFRL